MGGIIVSKRKMSLINLIVNYSNTFFLILNGLVLVPIYFKYFSLSVYGSYLAVANIAGILGLLEFGLSLVFTQKLAVLYRNQNFVQFSKLLCTGLITSFLLISVLLILTFLIAPYVSIWVKAAPEDYLDIKYAFIINSIGIAFNIYSNTITSIFQAWAKVQISGIVNVISAFIGILGTIAGLYFGLGVISISVGILCKSLCCVLGLLPFLIINYRRDRYPNFKFEKGLVISLLKDSLPVFGNTVSKSLIDNGQLLIITSFINPTATAIYSLSSKVFQVCSNLLAPIGSSIFSSLAQLVGENNNQNLKSNILKLFSIFTLFSILILVVCFSLNESFIKIWVGADKFGGNLLNFILCLNLFISSRFSYINFNLFALGIFGKTVMYDQIGAVIRLVLILILISVLGVISIPISEIVATLFTGIFINRLLVDKLGLDSKERNVILYFGFVQFVGLICFGLFYQWAIPISENWFQFFLYSSSWFILMSLMLFFLNKQFFMNHFSDFFKRVFIKKIEWKRKN